VLTFEIRIRFVLLRHICTILGLTVPAGDRLRAPSTPLFRPTACLDRNASGFDAPTLLFFSLHVGTPNYQMNFRSRQVGLNRDTAVLLVVARPSGLIGTNTF
jgi:hypothetical protein